MSSFFTAPASRAKRKRGAGDKPPPRPPKRAATRSARAARRDESISGSDDDDDEHDGRRDTAAAVAATAADDDDDELDGLDAAATRIALAERYLAATRQRVVDAGGFDAAEIDRELLAQRMGERLREDTAETRGKLYRWVADEFDWGGARGVGFRHHQKAVTGVAVAGDWAYTVGGDAVVVKWKLPAADPPAGARRKPQKAATSARPAGPRRDGSPMHTKAITCVAASQDGRFVATGGLDGKLVVWDAATLRPLKLFTYHAHRDSVDGLAFRRGTNQLFSAGRDRNVKIWSLDELTYVDTLYGHQDGVVDVCALAQEKCVTVGARDRTARLWKVVEESQLVFRGGGAPKSKSPTDDDPAHEGSLDRVACVDDDHFVTGSDNGSLSLWNVHKKKPVFTHPLAHGLDPPLPLAQLSAEAEPPAAARNTPQPRWITALRALPFSDTFVSGSWDGAVRVWRVTADKRRIEPLGPLADRVPGVVNDLAIADRAGSGDAGSLVVVAAVGKHHRLGRWREFTPGQNAAVLFAIPRKAPSPPPPPPPPPAAPSDSSEDAAFHSAHEGCE